MDLFLDSSKGFGGKFGTDENAQDKSAVGFSHKEALPKHSSQTGEFFGGCFWFYSENTNACFQITVLVLVVNMVFKKRNLAVLRLLLFLLQHQLLVNVSFFSSDDYIYFFQNRKLSRSLQHRQVLKQMLAIFEPGTIEKLFYTILYSFTV
jgi:hypothetical protein